MAILLKVACAAVSANTDLPSSLAEGTDVTPPSSQEEGAASSTAQPAAVHALNILRALYRDSRLGDHVVSFIPMGIKVAIAGFAASLWPVSGRN